MKEKLNALKEMDFRDVLTFASENRKTLEKVLLALIIGICLLIYFTGEKADEIQIENEAGQAGVAAESGSAGQGDVFGAVGSENAAAPVLDEDSGKIYVDVAGAVKKPGVVLLSEGARVFHAVDAAGGFSDDAAKDSLNLAMALSDGDKLYVPSVTEVLEAEAGAEGTFTDAGNFGSSGSNGKININKASSEELQSLNGIGTVTAAKIVSYREEHGKFKHIEDIKNVSGIGEGTFSKFKDNICV